MARECVQIRRRVGPEVVLVSQASLPRCDQRFLLLRLIVLVIKLRDENAVYSLGRNSRCTIGKAGYSVNTIAS